MIQEARYPAAGPLKLACNGLTTYLLNFLLARHDHINFLYKELLHNYNFEGEQSHFSLSTHQDHELIEPLHGEEIIPPTMFRKFNCEECGARYMVEGISKKPQKPQIKPRFWFCFVLFWYFIERNFANGREYKNFF